MKCRQARIQEERRNHTCVNNNCSWQIDATASAVISMDSDIVSINSDYLYLLLAIAYMN